MPLTSSTRRFLLITLGVLIVTASTIIGVGSASSRSSSIRNSSRRAIALSTSAAIVVALLGLLGAVPASAYSGGASKTSYIAMPIAGPGWFAADNLGLTTAGGDCSDGPGQCWYNVTYWGWAPDVSGSVTFDTCIAANYDTTLEVWTGTSATTFVTANDDSCNLQSSVTFAATAGQTYVIGLGAYSSGGNGTATVSFNAAGTPAEAPAITSANSASAAEQTVMSPFTVTTTGSPTPALSETGALPSGVTFADNGDGTATISGTPADGTAGPWPVTLTAANGIAPDATQAFTLTVAGVAPANAQTPVNDCVTPPRALPRRGARQLEKKDCVTVAGQLVGVRVRAQQRLTARGDVTYYALFCQVSKRKNIATKATGYGDGSRYCARGKLKIRTFGYKLKLRITWFAPATGSYTAYNRTKAYNRLRPRK